MSAALGKRFDARSTAVLVSTSGAFVLPIFAFVSPGFIRSGAMPALFAVWIYTTFSFAFTLCVGRLSDRQFTVIGFGGMVGVAISAFVVTDPAAAPAIVALLSAIPAIAAMASTRRVTLLFVLVAIVLAVSHSLYWSTSTAARMVAAGASILTVSVPVFMVAVLRSSLESAVEKVTSLGETDPLTGALNRRGLIKRHSQVFDHCRRNGSAIGFLFIDVDHFKTVNDNRGHAAGDRILVEAADTIAASAPPSSLVCRFGGEEFVVLCGVDSIADLSATAARIRAAVAERGQVTVSVGAVLARVELTDEGPPNVSEILDGLASHADRCVYWAKDHGRDRVILKTAPIVRWRPGLPRESVGTLSDMAAETGLIAFVRGRGRRAAASSMNETA